MGREFQFGEDEKVVEMDGGDGWTTKRMSLTPLTRMLKTGSNGQFYVMCMLPQ